MNFSRSAIEDKVRETSFIDVHEHLIEEKRRLAGPVDGDPLFPCDDWAYLFHHYAQDDLAVAGMPRLALDAFFSSDLTPTEKWHLFAPYWSRIRPTGFGRAVSYSVQQLFGEEEIRQETVAPITAKMRAHAQKGFYRAVLHETARIESCQVNSSERIFCETEYPDLLYQDLSTVRLSAAEDLAFLERETGTAIDTLDSCLGVIDGYFERYSEQAVAVKNQLAYFRRLDYENVPQDFAASAFARLVRDPESVQRADKKAVQDYLWRFCVRRATECGLPVKLHTGYQAGINQMLLASVGMNLGDLCPILQDFPETRFVLMHIAYPFQNEMIAVAKQYTNVYADLSCAWIISPLATVRFLKEFLVTAPWNKLLCFGGDYHCVENVVGHAEIARRGLVQTLSELVDEGWLSGKEALSLVEPLMHGNARDVFALEEKAGAAQAIALRRGDESTAGTAGPDE